MKHINGFQSIEIIDNSLIIIDIDNTIFKNKISTDESWWRIKYEQYFNISHDHNLAYNFVLQDWINVSQKNPPTLLDGTNLFIFLNKAKEQKCKIILLTARNKNLEQITNYHITHYGINNFIENTHFNIDKGTELLKIVEDNNICRDIIIIDDIYENILNMMKAFKTASFSIKMHCYLIEHGDLEL